MSHKLPPNLALRLAREQRGWSQARLAQHLDTSVKNVGRWERGETLPSPYFREKLYQLFYLEAEALGFPTSNAASTALPPPFPTMQPAPIPGESILDPARPCLTIAPEHLIERVALIQELLALLYNGTSCILYGLPGIGKTTLAQSLSLHPSVQRFFPDGLLWVSLGPTPDVHGALLRLATMLGAPANERRKASSTQTLSRYVHQLVAEQKILLVIDDVWSIDAVTPLLVGGSHTAHLVTTRLPSIAFAIPRFRAFAVPELDAAQSRMLLTRLVPQLNAYPEEALQQVLHAAGGLPLMVSLLGRYLRSQTIGGQRRRLDSALTCLSDAFLRLYSPVTQEPTEPPAVLHNEISSSVAAIISLSEQQLPQHARHALRALSVLPAKPENFSEAAALAVCQQGVEVLDLLLDAGLLEGAGDGRYRMHQTIADYGRQQLQNDAPWRHLVAYALRFCQEHTNDFPALTQELAVLQAAREVALHRGWDEELLQLILQLVSFWFVQGQHRLGTQHLQDALALAQQRQDYPRACETLRYLSLHAGALAQMQEAEAWAQTMLDLALQHRLDKYQAVALNALGVLAQKRGDHQEAQRHFQSILAMADRIDPSVRLPCLNNLAGSAFELGQLQQVQEFCQEGLTLSRQVQANDWVCGFLTNLAELYLHWSGHLELAEEYAHRAQELAERLQDPFEQTSIALILAQITCRKGSLAQAGRWLQQAYQQVEHTEHIHLHQQVSLESASIALAFQEVRRAEEYLLHLTQLPPLSTAKLRTIEQTIWGEVRLAQQRPEEAYQHFQAAETLATPHHVLLQALTRYGLARAAVALGRIEEARDVGRVCLASMKQMEYWQTEEVQAWLNRLFSETVTCDVEVEDLQMMENSWEMNRDPQTQEDAHCPTCAAARIVKRGKGPTGRQRYQCRACGRTFTATSEETALQERRMLARQLVAQGRSLRAVARQLGVSHPTVKAWLTSPSPLRQPFR